MDVFSICVRFQVPKILRVNESRYVRNDLLERARSYTVYYDEISTNFDYSVQLLLKYGIMFLSAQ